MKIFLLLIVWFLRRNCWEQKKGNKGKFGKVASHSEASYTPPVDKCPFSEVGDSPDQESMRDLFEVYVGSINEANMIIETDISCNTALLVEAA